MTILNHETPHQHCILESSQSNLNHEKLRIMDTDHPRVIAPVKRERKEQNINIQTENLQRIISPVTFYELDDMINFSPTQSSPAYSIESPNNISSFDQAKTHDQQSSFKNIDNLNSERIIHTSPQKQRLEIPLDIPYNNPSMSYVEIRNCATDPSDTKNLINVTDSSDSIRKKMMSSNEYVNDDVVESDSPIYLNHKELCLSLPLKSCPDAPVWMTKIEGTSVYITWIGKQNTFPKLNGEVDISSSSISSTPSPYIQVSGGKLILPPNYIPLIRRVDNNRINATLLLHAGGMKLEQERAIVLSLENNKVRYARKKSSGLAGTWIPLKRARDLARSFALDVVLDSFLSDELGQLYFDQKIDLTKKKRKSEKIGTPLISSTTHLLDVSPVSTKIKFDDDKLLSHVSTIDIRNDFWTSFEQTTNEEFEQNLPNLNSISDSPKPQKKKIKTEWSEIQSNTNIKTINTEPNEIEEENDKNDDVDDDFTDDEDTTFVPTVNINPRNIHYIPSTGGKHRPTLMKTTFKPDIVFKCPSKRTDALRNIIETDQSEDYMSDTSSTSSATITDHDDNVDIITDDDFDDVFSQDGNNTKFVNSVIDLLPISQNTNSDLISKNDFVKEKTTTQKRKHSGLYQKKDKITLSNHKPYVKSSMKRNNPKQKVKKATPKTNRPQQQVIILNEKKVSEKFEDWIPSGEVVKRSKDPQLEDDIDIDILGDGDDDL